MGVRALDLVDNLCVSKDQECRETGNTVLGCKVFEVVGIDFRKADDFGVRYFAGKLLEERSNLLAGTAPFGVDCGFVSDYRLYAKTSRKHR